ncbi:hypothetical protein WEH80_34765 [Actinomycetes bacterium KLBMP 9759]
MSTVIGHRGTLYPYADVAGLDRHIGELRERITHTDPTLRTLISGYWTDIDRLLEHRFRLTHGPDAAALCA